MLAFLVGLMALLGDLIAANRRLTEQLLVQVRQLDVAFNRVTDGPAIPGLRRTDAPVWTDALTPPTLAALATPALAASVALARRPGDAA